MSKIAQVPFHGTFLHTALDEHERPVVVLKPTITAMGLDWAAQWTKLQRRSWAVVGQTPTTGRDGKTYMMASCDLDTWSMLLANIDEHKVKPEARPLVIAYQKESARVLRQYWANGIAPPSLQAMDERVPAIHTAPPAPPFPVAVAGITTEADVAKLLCWLRLPPLEDPAEQHLWRTPGLNRAQRIQLVYFLDTLRRQEDELACRKQRRGSA